MIIDTLTFNCDNWTGQQETVRIHSNGDFNLMGYTFRLVRRSDQEDDVFPYLAEIQSDDWPDKLGTVMRYHRDQYYTAMGSELTRDNKEPILAACQLLCNLI